MDSASETPRIFTRATVRTARYALLGAEPADARRVWFVLHGYAQLAPRFLRHFAGHVPKDCCVVAPEGLNRFYVDMPRRDGSHLQRVGATWMTREAREDDIADTMRWLDTLCADIMAMVGREVPVGVLGFSQGVATATRWLAGGAVQPGSFVAWAGGVAHDVGETAMRHALGEATVTLVCGEQDPFFAPETRSALLTTLQEWQPRTALVTFEGAHHLDGDVLAPLLDALAPRP
jgi:dienelactone hydrolase